MMRILSVIADEVLDNSDRHRDYWSVMAPRRGTGHQVSRYYPVALDLRNRPCLVVGGGSVAETKVEGLLFADARVTVVSPALSERLASWATEGRTTYRQ